MPRERELQRWEPGADSTIDMSLEDSGEAGWDQFAINERMYGVSSTYDENIYTTQIDRSDPRYKQREAEAARIAREIEGSAPVNAHVAEERRRDTDRGDGLDEEEKYSGVKRDPALPRRAAGAYVPPSQRPITNMPTVPGAPYDPAIISSQLVKPASQLSPEKAADQARAIEPVAGEEQNATSTETVAKDSKSIAQPTQPPKKPAENTTEDHVRNVTDSFKQFANNEKLRLRLAQEQKRSAQRAEKNVKLNDLKKFAENFKLRSRVPDDLVPILAKDREKQIEIQHKADEAAKEEAVKSKEREREKTAGASSPAPSSASHAGVVDPRLQFTPYSKARVPGNVRGQQPLSGQTQPPRQPAGGQQNRAYAHPAFPPRPQPLPTDLRIPTGPAIPPTDVGPLSPTSATRLNVNAKAFEFRPAASAFTPTGATPSPQRSMAGSDHPAAPETADFFSKDKKPVDTKEKMDLDELFNPIQRMLGEATEEQKNALISTGGVPQPYRTPPTWPREDSLINTSYLDLMPKSAETSRPQSQMHTPNPNTAQMPHAHQLPPHMQGAQVSTPSQRPPYLPPPHHHHQQPYGPGMQQFGPNGSVQSSPRFQPPQMAFNGQMPAMPMPQFAGQMQPYGMSPNMQYRQPNIPPQGPMMMMGPGQGHAQSECSLIEPPMSFVANADVLTVGQMPPGYPRGPNQFTPQMMGGVPMANQPSGGFMGGPIPQQQSYSPMPHHATPHMQHMQPGGYTGSPRPPMMQQTASHQGFQPNPMHMGHPPPPHFAPSPATGPAHPYHLQQRQMSGPGAYHPHMTPRQQQVVPMQHSPGMVGSHGDEGK